MTAKKHLMLTTTSILFLALFVIGCTTIPFEAVSIACPDGEVNLSNEPLFEGPGITDVTVTEAEEIFVDTVTFPTRFPGSSWISPGQGRVTPTGFSVTHFGYGTGDFSGAQIAYVVSPLDEPVGLPCDPVGPTVKLEGVIVLPPGP